MADSYPAEDELIKFRTLLTENEMLPAISSQNITDEFTDPYSNASVMLLEKEVIVTSQFYFGKS